jgi:XTP/dITP diphosphohydrolase
LTKLLIATHNAGKLREYRALLADLAPHVEITSLRQEGLNVETEEAGETFAQNAVLKALVYARASGLITLADDSGLEVDALDGAPGIRSARYGGPGVGDVERYQKLLAALRDVPRGRRSARFRCVVALASPDGGVTTAEGVVEGKIGFRPRGQYGFGYDPVFVVDGRQDQTMAQLDPDLKNRISHRARAIAAIRGSLEEELASDPGSRRLKGRELPEEA